MAKFLRTRLGIFDMRRAHKKWPRIDGGRWMVRKKNADTYATTFFGALLILLTK